ncbi:ACP S-malonyltransferase [Glaciimonas sp. GNP009]
MKTYLFPGQGSQHVGMGANLFDAFPNITATADTILGYSVKELCLKDPQRQLGQTQYTQPALFVVNALAYRQRIQETGERPDFVAGHSLGEYNALESAGVIHFEDGLRLVQKRGELMSKAPKGAMAAVIGIGADRIAGILQENGLTGIDIANYNTHNQTIISGLEADIRDAQPHFEKNQAMYMPLNVGGAFHSRYMKPAHDEFKDFLQNFGFYASTVPVIANVDALPYPADRIAWNLSDQLTHSVRWLDSMHYLLDQGQGSMEFIELGPGDVLTKLMRSIQSKYVPKAQPVSPAAAASRVATAVTEPAASIQSPQQVVDNWNRKYPVGTRVSVKAYEGVLTTKTVATLLFGHRAAVYLEGYNGYFALDEVQPVETVDSAA